MNLSRVVPVVLSAGMLSACIACQTTLACPAPSPAYARVQDLNPDAITQVMREMPLDQRLDIYHDVYVRSGHPRTMLTRGFEDTGANGFDAVLARMEDPTSFNEYFWIIHAMGLRREIDICDPRFFEPLHAKVRQFGRSDPAHPVPIRFDRCELTL